MLLHSVTRRGAYPAVESGVSLMDSRALGRPAAGSEAGSTGIRGGGPTLMLMLVLLGAAGPERRGVEASAVLKVATLSLGSQRHCCTVNVGLPAVQKHETVRCPPAMRCQRQNIRTVAHHPEAPSGSSNTGTAVCQSCANTPLTFTNRASGTASPRELRCDAHLTFLEQTEEPSLNGRRHRNAFYDR